MEKRVVLYCSASASALGKYEGIARSVVDALVGKGYEIVSGGTVKGIMKVIVDETKKCGGRHIGVIPRFMKDIVHPDLDEVIWTDTMSERKKLLHEGTDAAVALPGGIGTLDELVETYTLRKMGLYKGQVFAVNYEGFYEPFKALLRHYVDNGVLDAEALELIAFPRNAEELSSGLL